MPIDTKNIGVAAAAIDAALTKAFGALTEMQVGVSAKPKTIAKVQAGKQFEAYVFARLVRRIGRLLQPTYQLLPMNMQSGRFEILGSPGFADTSRCFVSIQKAGEEIARMWTGVQFLGLSGVQGSGLAGDIHEADILIERIEGLGQQGKYLPDPESIVAVFECKLLTDMQKNILRNQLGLRREMSFVRTPQRSAAHALVGSRHSRRALFAPRLPATQGTDGRLASHLFLAYAKKISGVDPKSAWRNPAATFGLEYWGL